MSVYIYERIDIDGGGRGRFIDLLRGRWANHVEGRYGVRLAGLWATVGSTAGWPEAALLWEMEDWAHFARAQQDQYPVEDKDAFGTELRAQALEYRKYGHSSLLTPSPFASELAQVSVGEADVYLYEDVRTRPGGMRAYHEALAGEYLPVAAERGLQLAGAFCHALQPNTGINLWRLDGWDHWVELMESEPEHAPTQSWLGRCAELLDDLDAYLLATPPPQALRT